MKFATGRLFIILFLKAFFATTIYGQITIQRADLPQAGDEFTLSIAAPLSISFDFEQSGPNHVWNYAMLKPASQMQDSFFSMSEVNNAYKIYFGFNQPNMAQPLAGIPFLQNMPQPPQDAYSFYKNSSSQYVQNGYGFSIQSLPLGVPFKKPDVIYNFPLTYKQQDSSESYFEFEVPNMLFFSRKQIRKNQVDGWGKITTPYGTFDVLRVRTLLVQDDSMYISSQSTGTRLPLRKTVELKWLAKGTGAEILKVTAAMNNGQFRISNVAYLDSARVQPNSVKNIVSNPDIKLYPNPTGKFLYIGGVKNAYTPGGQAAGIKILDLNGRIVFTHNSQLNNNAIDVSALPAGLYIVHIQQGNDLVLRRFVKM